jgi:hypothetical protein
MRVFSRAASISGQITDTNQKPVPGATITISSTGHSTTSDNNGYYQFSSYQLGSDYGLVNQVPAVIDTVSVEAVACEPQPGRSIRILAESGASEVNFTLNRAFYPADFDLSQFTLVAFPGWSAAKEFATWQNIIGITVDGDVQSTRWRYGSREISPLVFDIGNKKLYLMAIPGLGRYSFDIRGAPGTEYKVAAASTLNGVYLQPVTTDARLGSGGSQRLTFTLEPNQMQLQVNRPFPVIWIIIPVAIIILGGLVTAYFLTGGRERWGKLFAGIKWPMTKEPAAARQKAAMNSNAKRSTRRRKNSNMESSIG